jgi:hypothetical protein
MKRRRPKIVQTMLEKDNKGERQMLPDCDPYQSRLYGNSVKHVQMYL